MIVSSAAHAPVLWVASNMRAIDQEEIYALRYEANPFHIVNDVMAAANFSWVAWHDGLPAAVFGGVPRHPGVWEMYCFGTDAFPRVALGITRMARKEILPRLFGELGAHRLQADSHEKHVEAHRWLELLGCKRESVLVGYGGDRSNYFRYVLSVPLDQQNRQG